MTKSELLSNLKTQLPDISFKSGGSFSWSSRHKTITYPKISDDKEWSWALLHEVGHATLEHQDYKSDFELLLIEIDAWDKAKELSSQYGVEIDDNHIQDCLDTYRDWLYARSTCPTCTASSVQIQKVTYKCFNCATVWKVSDSRHCRPYRLTTQMLI